MVANTLQGRNNRNKDVRKAVDNLIRLLQNSVNKEGETPVVGSNSISTSNSVSNSSNIIFNFMERTKA